MKKFVVSVIILVVFFGVLLFIGWTQFSIPSGTTGVMISKTGGIHSAAIVPGNFTWRWERLIPTNTEIRVFSMYPRTITTTLQGSLPSSDIYSPMLEGKPDFSYSFSMTVEVQLKQSALPSFVRRTNALSQDELHSYLDSKAQEAAKDVLDFVLLQQKNSSLSSLSISYDYDAIVKHLQSLSKYSDINIDAVSIQTVKLPDIELYLLAKEAYSMYQDKVRNALASLTNDQSVQSAEDYLQIERFSRWGKVLQDYPILIDFIAVSKEDSLEALEAVRSIKKP